MCTLLWRFQFEAVKDNHLHEMDAYPAFIVLVSLATLAASIPANIKSQKNGKAKIAVQPVLRNPAYLLYEELTYIYSTQQGNGTVPRPKTLTPCARAILGCCKAGQMEEKCSVDVGCGAYFFDDNPCDENFVKLALNAARAYYEQFVGTSEFRS